MSPGAEPVQIPDKLFFRIGEAAQLTGVEPYVLRFWEGEFGRLKPRRSGSGQRMYRRSDVEMILTIKHLLWERKLTIAGARKELARPKAAATSPGGVGPAGGPAARAAQADPAQARRLDELEGQLRAAEERTRQAEQRAREATARAVLAENRCSRAERTLQEVAADAERHRKDLETVRQTLRHLRSGIAAYIEELR